MSYFRLLSPRTLGSLAAGVLLAIALLVTTASGQTRPDFSGDWKMLADQSSGSSSYGSTVTIRQSASTLTVVLSHEGQSDSATYNLNGSESRHSATGAVETQSVASWSGNELVIVTRIPIGPEEITRRLSLNVKGNLVVTTLFASSDRRETTVYTR